MEFFGFGGSSVDLSTPLGILVRAATDPLLVGPDWAKNMEICDLTKATRDGPSQTLRAITRRLQETNSTVVALALVVAETCMKNCGPAFAAAVTSQFMEEMVAVGRGGKGERNAEDALRIIQQWGRVFESRRTQFPLFFDTYMSLKTRGIRFPPEEEGVTASFEDRPREPPAPVVRAPVVRSAVDESLKLEQDLTTVYEKVRLCIEMLPESPGIQSDEALAEVIGFLEACRDRMIDVIEAASQGMLSEELFEKCLRVNDAILRTLEAEKNGTPISLEEDVKAEGAGESKSSNNGDLLDLGTSNSGTKSVQAAVMREEDEDEFGSLTLKTAGRGKAPAVAKKPIAKLAPPPTGLHVQRPAPAASNASGLLDLDSPSLRVADGPGPVAAATTGGVSDNSDVNKQVGSTADAFAGLPASTTGSAFSPSSEPEFFPPPAPAAGVNTTQPIVNPFDAPTAAPFVVAAPVSVAASTANELDALFSDVAKGAPSDGVADAAPKPQTTPAAKSIPVLRPPPGSGSKPTSIPPPAPPAVMSDHDFENFLNNPGK